MDEIVVKVARAIASLPRLKILSHLASVKEKAPTELADKLDRSPNVLSAHLAKLVAAGLIQRRRSGAWSYCVFASPYPAGTLSGDVAAWLRELLKAPAAEAESVAHETLFDAATAFTDLRRLQILRYLSAGHDATVNSLCFELSMSEVAVGRQTSKLIRRGYLASRTIGREGRFRLATESKTAIHAKLFEIIRTTWGE